MYTVSNSAGLQGGACLVSKKNRSYIVCCLEICDIVKFLGGPRLFWALKLLSHRKNGLALNRSRLQFVEGITLPDVNGMGACGCCQF